MDLSEFLAQLEGSNHPDHVIRCLTSALEDAVDRLNEDDLVAFEERLPAVLAGM